MSDKIKFTIITPTNNSEKYLEKTIYSVLSQEGDFDIEYIVVDNESIDNTSEIVEKCRANLNQLISKKMTGRIFFEFLSGRDGGMYEAINRGFAKATGNIFAWINSDDLFLPGAFASVARVLTAKPEVHWLKGITTYIDAEGQPIAPGSCFLYAQSLIRFGLYGREAYFIQQDSVFWRSSLWDSVGGLDGSLRLAGDFDLWMRFAERAPLFVLNQPVSCFRKVAGQLSENLEAYRIEQKRIPRKKSLKNWFLGIFFSHLEPKLPAYLKYIIFRCLCPLEPLRVVEFVGKTVRLRNSFKYVV